MKKIFCPSSCHSKIQILDHLLKLVLNLYAFSANAARIKRQHNMVDGHMGVKLDRASLKDDDKDIDYIWRD